MIEESNEKTRYWQRYLELVNEREQKRAQQSGVSVIDAKQTDARTITTVGGSSVVNNFIGKQKDDLNYGLPRSIK